MQETQLYEYAVLRYVPSVEREEFVNVGLVMMCKRCRWLKIRVFINEKRVLAFLPEAPVAMLREQLVGFCKVASGERGSGPIGECPVEERFRWIAAAKSAIIQTSRPHPGITEDLECTFERLFEELVM